MIIHVMIMPTVQIHMVTMNANAILATRVTVVTVPTLMNVKSIILAMFMLSAKIYQVSLKILYMKMIFIELFQNRKIKQMANFFC